MNDSNVVIGNVLDRSGDWYVYSSAVRISLVFVLCVFGLKYLQLKESPQARFWKAHPIPGASNRWLKWLRTMFESVHKSKELVDDGYSKVT
jgi:hypothetical protein